MSYQYDPFGTPVWIDDGNNTDYTNGDYAAANTGNFVLSSSENSGTDTANTGSDAHLYTDPKLANISTGSDTGVSIDTNMADPLTQLKSIFTNPDGSYNWKAILGAGGAGAVALDKLTGGNLFSPKQQSTGYQGGIPSLVATRAQVPGTNPAGRRPGSGGQRYFTDTQFTPASDVAAAQAAAQAQAQQLAAANVQPQRMASGGIAGRYLQGKTDGMADHLPANIDGNQPAKLSHGEFVIPADVVSHLGNGNSDAGAQKLYQMMDKIRMARTGTKRQGKQINPDKFMPGGLAKLASGGHIPGYAGTTDGSVVTAPTGTTGTESNLSNWAGPYVTDMLGKADALANQPYQAYQGPLTAGSSPLQDQGFQQAGNLSTPASIGQAATTAGNIANTAQNINYTPTNFTNTFNAPGAYQAGNITSGTFDSTAAQKYMNPYLSGVLNPQLDEMRRQAGITQVGNDAKMTQAGAFGGDRQALLTAENNRNLLQQQDQAVGTAYNNAYNNAQSQFNADQARSLQAQQATEQSRQFGASQGMTAAQLQAQYGLSADQAAEQSRQFGANYGLQGLNTALSAAQTQGNMGVQQNQASLADLNALLGAGATQRGIESEGIAADKAQFEEERANPYKMLQFKQSMLQGLPVAATQYNTATPNLYQQLLAGGSMGTGLYDLLYGKAPTTTAP